MSMFDTVDWMALQQQQSNYKTCLMRKPCARLRRRARTGLIGMLIEKAETPPPTAITLPAPVLSTAPRPPPPLPMATQRFLLRGGLWELVAWGEAGQHPAESTWFPCMSAWVILRPAHIALPVSSTPTQLDGSALLATQLTYAYEYVD
jgi:hypothetical protein